MLVRLIARSYRAISRKDVAAIMQWWADDAVFEFPGRMPISGRIVGKAAIADWWQRVFDRMAEIRFTPRRAALANPVMLTFRNTLFVELTVDARTHDGLTAHGELVSVLTYRRGKVVHARDYFLDPSAEEAIWGRLDQA